MKPQLDSPGRFAVIDPAVRLLLISRTDSQHRGGGPISVAG
jgi:hypothetical protein